MKIESLPFDANGILHARRAVKAGVDRSRLSRAVQAGELTRLLTGVFVVSEDRTPGQLHLLKARAVSQAHPEMVLSHEAAAVVHGFSMLKPAFDAVEIVAPRRVRAQGLQRRVLDLQDDDVDERDGIRATSRALTAITVACTSPMGFAGALTVLDSALRAGVSRRSLEAALQSNRKGIGIARRAFEFADSGAANPGESWSRAQMILGGLPVPRLQHRFRDAHGDFVARSDFDWDGLVVGEFDGYGKYFDYNSGTRTAYDVLRDEKRREARLKALGIDVVRWDCNGCSWRTFALSTPAADARSLGLCAETSLNCEGWSLPRPRKRLRPPRCNMCGRCRGFGKLLRRIGNRWSGPSKQLLRQPGNYSASFPHDDNHRRPSRHCDGPKSRRESPLERVRAYGKQRSRCRGSTTPAAGTTDPIRLRGRPAIQVRRCPPGLSQLRRSRALGRRWCGDVRRK